MPKSTRSEVATAWAVVAQAVSGASASIDDFTRFLTFPKAIFSHVPASASRGCISAPAIIRELLCVTRTRVPHMASTTLVHRNIVIIVISNAHSLLSTLFSHKTKRSNQPYSLIRFDQDGLSQITAKPRHSRQNLDHKMRLRRPQKGRSKT
jgi:hypothetical protein